MTLKLKAMRNTMKLNIRKGQSFLRNGNSPNLFPAQKPKTQGLHSICTSYIKNSIAPSEPISSFNCSTTFRCLSTASTTNTTSSENPDELLQDGVIEDEEVEPIDTWEEEDEAEPEIGDGGDGGGVVLQNCAWGEQALAIAREVLEQFGEDMKLFAFKTSPRGYIYVRIDKLSGEYGCPSMEEIEKFSHQYKKKLDGAGEIGELPDDLALEVSSPGAERLLKVPDDLQRFKDMPMTVIYADDSDSKCPVKNTVFFLESIDVESGCCVWKLADVKENRDPSAKGRPLSRKRKDWRLQLPFKMCKKVTLHLGY